MAIGKNKGLAKGGKKGSKKKQQDPFLKKVWYNIKAPSYFQCKALSCGKTVVTKTAGTKIESEGLKGRICEFNLADIAKENEDGYKKIKLEIQEIQGKNCLTDFHGLSLTRDKMCQMIKKRHSLIEAVEDVKTQDGYTVRLFVIGFTKEVKDQQVKVFSYAQSAQVKKIRKAIRTILHNAASTVPLKDLVKKLLCDQIETEIAKHTQRIYPMDPVHIQKVKIVKKPKLDITKLMEIHDKADDAGVAVTESEESKNLLSSS